MDALSSCYFCGAALDEPLADYPVLPPALREGTSDGPRVTLCPGCKRKLERILAAVRDAQDADGSDGADRRDSPAGVDETAGSDEPGADVDASESDSSPIAGPEDGTLIDPFDGSSVSLDEPPTSDSVTAPSPDEGAAVDDPSRPEGDAVADPADPADTVDTAETADTTDAADDVDTGDGPDVADVADTAGAADTADGHGEAGTREGDVGNGSADASSGEAASAVDGSGLTALEYNEVMRLLQNREFPVDRDEIVTVAANAYDLSRADCAAVIDLAIERGLLAEADGKLSRPE